MAASFTRTTSAGVPYTYVTDSAGAYAARDHLLKHKVIAHDTETTGLCPHKDKVILAQFSSKEHTFVIDTRNPDLLKIQKPVLENEEIYKVEFNGIFDYEMDKGTAGIDTENIFCLKLGEQSMHAGIQFSGNDLETVTKKYLGISRDKTLQKSFIGHKGDFSVDQLDYGADDTRLLLDIAPIMQKKAKEMGVLHTWQTENGAIQPFGDIEFYGQKIDAPAWTKLMEFQELAAKQAKRDLDKWFIPIVGEDLFSNAGMEYEGLGGAAINYNSQPQVLYALQMMGLKIDGETIQDTGKKMQKKLIDHGAIQALSEFRRAEKLLGTYGQQYLDAINPLTGRVHFKFNQYGTETGRPTCRAKLNCLNIPRDPRYRSAFITELRRLLSTVDYSAAELRILAELSGDRLMIEGFNSGIDFHCYVASMLFGVEVTKKNENRHLREPTKQLNFGIAYGMSPFSLYEKLRYELKQDTTLEKCKDLFERYQKTFKEAIFWLKSQQKTASTEFQMTNMNGRRRHWFKPDMQKIRFAVEKDLTKNGKLKLTDDMEDQIPELVQEKTKAHLAAIQREGANFQIQSVNADFAKRAMATLRKDYKKRGWDGRMYNMVYDEIVTDHEESTAQEAHEHKMKVMNDSANAMLKKVPMQVEGHLAACWTK